MVLGGIQESRILEIINTNTYQNLNARTHLATWRKK